MWVGHGPNPQHNGYTERDGKMIHRLELFPGIIAEGTVDDLREKLGMAGLALAEGERDMIHDFAEEGRRRHEAARSQELERRYLA